MDIGQRIREILDKHIDEGQNTDFSFEDVVACIRASNVFDFFDFATFDNDVKRSRQAELRSLSFRWRIDGRFTDAHIRIPDFIRRKNIDKHFIPQIFFEGGSFYYWKLYYRTIPQLVSSLSELFPLIESCSLQYVEEEKEVLALRKKRQAIIDGIPDLIRKYMQDESIQYACRQDGEESVSVAFKLPKKTRVTVKLKIDDIEKALPYAVYHIAPFAKELVNSYTRRIRIEGYGNNEEWKTIEK